MIAAETVVRTFLAGAFDGTRVVTETPANLADVLPVIEVTTIGGFDPLVVLDVVDVDVDVYGTARDAARTLAEQVRTALRNDLPGSTVAGAFVAQVDTVALPRWTPYDNTKLRRFTATYRVAIRSTE